MPVFYYLDGKERKGPYSIDELQQQPLVADSFIWYDRLPAWTPLKEVPEVFRYFNHTDTTAASAEYKPVPPPVDLIITSLPATPLPSVKETSTGSGSANYLKKYSWAFYWCLFHTLAMFLAIKDVPFFNNTGTPRTDKFWPFVKFTDPYFFPDDVKTYSRFNGLFTQYDWTEFSFYCGLVLFVVALMIVYKKTK